MRGRFGSKSRGAGALFALVLACSESESEVAAPSHEPDGYARDPIVSHLFTADPSAKVFDGRVYVYASHDLDDQSAWDMVDYHVFSSDDLVNWQDHGVALNVADVPWASKLYAPDCCRDPVTGRYFLYFPDGTDSIGVAVSDSPSGPFVDVLGRPLITRDYPGVTDVEWVFDPTCFIDDDGRAYLYFGGGPKNSGANARVIRLSSDLSSLADSEATRIEAPDFFEASFAHRRGERYFFSYSTTFLHHAPTIDYLVSDDPMTGFEYVGTLLPNPADNEQNNNHHSVVEYRGSSYVFFHHRALSLREGFSSFQRSITLDNLRYDERGLMVPLTEAKGLVAQVKSGDARRRWEAETLAAQRGIETDSISSSGGAAGVAVTSIHEGDWAGYSQLDFGDGAARFRARVGGPGAGGDIEVRVGGCEGFTESAGELAASCRVPASDGAWSDVECAVKVQPGVHDLCLRFRGAGDESLFRLDWFQFEK